MILGIVSRAGVVHNLDSSCPDCVRAKRRVPVTALQARIFHLPVCRVCFPHHQHSFEARAS